MRVGFSGYSDGDPVAITVEQGGVRKSAAVDRWNNFLDGTGVGSIEVKIRRSSLGVAPEGFQFEVTGYAGFDTPAPSGVFDERYHDFHFEWSFGDEGATYTVPTRLPAEHRNANVGYGPAAAHVYKKRGTYEVTCKVMELSSGKKALWKQKVTIGDRETLFGGDATIYVDDEGKFAKAPAGAQTVTTLTAALDLCKTQKAIRRIMLRRGRKHPHPAQYDFRTGNVAVASWWNVWVEAEPGTGARPVIDCTGTYGNGAFYVRLMSRAAGPGTLDMVWFDVDFQGQWDSTTESGNPRRCFWLYEQDEARPKTETPPDYFMMQGCTMSGFSQNVYGDKFGVQFLSDCHITNWQDYGWFGDTGWLSVLGTKIEQHVDALSGGPKNGQHNNHGCVRFHHAEQLVIDGSELFSRNGWFPNTKGYTTIQPCMRFGMDGRPNDRMNLQRSVLESGFPLVAIGHTNNDEVLNNVNVRMESLLLIGSFMTPFLANSQYGGVTVRNCIGVQPNVQRLGGIYEPSSFLTVKNAAEDTSSLERILVEFCTIVNLSDSAEMNGIFSDKSFDPLSLLIERRNILHQPNLGRPGLSSELELDALVFAAPLFKGYRFKWERYEGTLSAAVADGASFTVAYSGGNAGYFAAAGTHTISLSRDATFEFGPSSVKITNVSGKTWASGASWVVTLEREKAHLLPFAAATATPSDTVALFAPSAGQSGLGGLEKVDETVQVDFLGRERPPYLTIGAMEVLS